MGVSFHNMYSTAVPAEFAVHQWQRGGSGDPELGKAVVIQRVYYHVQAHTL